MIKLTDKEFEEIVTFMHGNYGIDLRKKRQLIESRMHAVLLKRGFHNFSDYFQAVKSDPKNEIDILINKLTTNHTFFLREPTHFDFMNEVILPHHRVHNKQKDLRIWSAGCSSGEEAYTAIMVMNEFFGKEKGAWDYSILATDISMNVLTAAKNSVYNIEDLKEIPDSWLKKYFVKRSPETYVLSPTVINQVIFRTFNLMEPISYKKPFDLIFCRNVMIYFDLKTKTDLVNRFYEALNPGGYLFIGHSESIQRDKTRFKYVRPSIFQKV